MTNLTFPASLTIGPDVQELHFPGKLVEMDIPGNPHKAWEIIRNQVIWEQDGKPTQFLTILAIGEDGEDLGKEAITVNSDMYDIVDI